jgi:arginyl-tRNA synthetase
MTIMSSVSLKKRLEKVVQSWVKEFAPEANVTKADLVTPCQDQKFGHFQTNAAMVCAKQLKKNPKELAASVAEYCFKEESGLEKVEIAGPGFVNFTFRAEFTAEILTAFQNDESFGIPTVDDKTPLIVEYPSLNVAKEAHIGHIRTMILGESLNRVFRALGYNVVSDDHIGDWGTPFGKIILGYKQKGKPALENEANPMAYLDALYVEVNVQCNENEAVLEEAKQEVVKFQSGDPESMEIWNALVKVTMGELHRIYERMGVTIPDNTLGESFYNHDLKAVVDELKSKGVAKESEGAIVVFFPEDHKELHDKPMLIVKADGAALYATTDIATIKYRVNHFKAKRAIVPVDARQRLHFIQLNEVTKMLGYDFLTDHIEYGMILGTDKKPIKTRDGKNIKLKELLDEARDRSLTILKEKRPEMDNASALEKAEVIGIGAIKYADLMQNRNLDYVFDWDRLLSFEGNTAPYLLNAYVRTRSILRKAEVMSPVVAKLVFTHELEDELARKILDFGDVIERVASECRPHYLCVYLYELAGLFHRFFEHCPVLKADTEEAKQTRLVLCKIAGDVLQKGLNLLGIKTIEEM